MTNRDARWASFLEDPGAWASPRLAASLIAPGLGAETAARLFASPRLGARASRFLAARLGSGDPAVLAPAERALAAAPAETLEAVAARAGAVWHARRVCGLVLGSEIAAFVARHGEPARRAALGHRALAAESVPMEPGPMEPGEEALAADIARDGALCLEAWIAGLPPWVAARVRLKWAGDAASGGTPYERERRAAIVRALAPEALAAEGLIS